MMAFCENRTECRRAYVLSHFGESFKREACQRTCDNCRLGAAATPVDVTLPAAAACAFLASQPPLTMTLNQVAEVFAGNIGDKKVAARLGGLRGTPFWALGERLQQRGPEYVPPPRGAVVPSISVHTGKPATKDDGVRMLQRLIMTVRVGRWSFRITVRATAPLTILQGHIEERAVRNGGSAYDTQVGCCAPLGISYAHSTRSPHPAARGGDAARP